MRNRKWDHGEGVFADPVKYRMRQLKKQRSHDRAYCKSYSERLNSDDGSGYREYLTKQPDYGESVVYFILARDSRRVKIGVTDDLVRRLKHLQTANASSLEVLVAVPGGYAAEKRVHHLFSRDRIRGEWFRYSKNIERFVGGLLWEIVN